MADAQAAPLLEKLKADQANPDLLTSVGNLYYDAHQYPTAIDYYGRALKVRPSDAPVRTDMGTAYWYMGNADAALAEFDKALTFAPTNPSTLFNRGLVRLQGKKDSAGAIADWEKLLAANPAYQGRNQVEQMMAEARKQSPTRPENNTK
jgi:tetratricopeptide (TPR) repeat protein